MRIPTLLTRSAHWCNIFFSWSWSYERCSCWTINISSYSLPVRRLSFWNPWTSCLSRHWLHNTIHTPLSFNQNIPMPLEECPLLPLAALLHTTDSSALTLSSGKIDFFIANLHGALGPMLSIRINFLWKVAVQTVEEGGIGAMYLLSISLIAIKVCVNNSIQWSSGRACRKGREVMVWFSMGFMGKSWLATYVKDILKTRSVCLFTH